MAAGDALRRRRNAIAFESLATALGYLASWLAVLREDNRAIFRAASAASKAADWLLSRHAEAQAERIAA